MGSWKIGVVIPARNEESNLPETIQSIRASIPADRLAGVVVVDNGSSDSTVSVARGLGASVVLAPHASLGGLRNRGAHEVDAPVVMFLDADVSLAHDWAKGLEDLDRLLEQEEMVVTGSWCEAPIEAGWVARAWNPLTPKTGSVPHLGTAHMILTYRLFDRLGGFNEELSSGEDFDLCTRSRDLGAQVVAIPQLRAIHRGEPAGVREFFLREVWHGTGDVMNLRTAIRSYVANAAVLFTGLHLAFVGGLLTGSRTGRVVALASALLLLLMVFGSAVRKHRRISIGPLARTSLLVWVYLWARTISLMSLAYPSLKASPRGREVKAPRG